jgi:hypothetical protein
VPIHKLDPDGKFVPFEKTPFPDLEEKLEDWIEKNPHVVLEDENLAVFARQPRTSFDKYLDLLALDETGATVIIELKRGETPRDVVAQTVEYAAWVDSLTIDQLNDLAHDYAQKRSIEAQNLADLYRRTFVSGETGGEGEPEAVERVTFNNRQRLVIVAERISNEVEQTLRYLRTRLGADVYGVEFSVHRASSEIIISTTTIVGREKVSKPAQTWTPRERESDEATRARVKGEFMQEAVTAIEDWVANCGIDGLTVDHSTASDHFIRYLGVSWVYYYYATGWVYMNLYSPKEDEIKALQSRMSKPQEVKPIDGGKYWRCHVATKNDLEVIKEIVSRRAAARKEAIA